MEKRDNAEETDFGKVGEIETVDDVAAAIAAHCDYGERRYNERDSWQMAEFWGITNDAARYRLAKRASQGKIKRRKILEGNHWRFVYSAVSDE